MSGNVYVQLCEKGGGQKWRCCTSLSYSMGSAFFFFFFFFFGRQYDLNEVQALHLRLVGLPSSGACISAFL